MIKPQQPFRIGTRRVKVPVAPRPTSAKQDLTTSPFSIIPGRRFPHPWWGLYDTEPALVTADATVAVKGVYATLPSLQLMGVVPIGMTRAGGFVTDADTAQAEGYPLGGFGRPGYVVRAPKTILILDPGGIGNNTSFVTQFQARYAAQLAPKGVEAYSCFAPATFAGAVPMTAVSIGTHQSVVVDYLGSTKLVKDLAFTPFAVGGLQGGQVLVVAMSGNRAGYQCGTLVNTNGYCYVMESSFFYNFNPVQPAPVLTNSVLLAQQIGSGSNTSEAVYCRNDVPAAEAVLIKAVAARCDRFAFDVIGLPDFNSGFPTFLTGYTALDVDSVCRNGVPGQTTVFNGVVASALANKIADRAVAFFN
jgi:hypothetical protein